MRSGMSAAEFDYGQAQDHVDLLMRSGSTSARRWALAQQAAIDQASGELTLAERRWQDSRPSDDPMDVAAWRAWTELQVRQQRVTAARIMDEALAAAGQIDTIDGGLDYAIFYAVAGRTDDARYWQAADRRASNRYSSSPAPLRAAEDAQFQAYVAFGEGRFTDAVRSLQQAERDFNSFHPEIGARVISWDLARAFDRAGEADSAIARYERALGYGDALQVHRQAREYPITLIRLAARYDERGDMERAAGYYGRFFELWAEADPDLQPRVEAARARLDEIARERG